MIENVEHVHEYIQFMGATINDPSHLSRTDPSDPLYEHAYTRTYHSWHRSHTRDCDNVFLTEPVGTFPIEVEAVVKWSVRSLYDAHISKCNHEDNTHFDPVYMYAYTLQLHVLYKRAEFIKI